MDMKTSPDSLKYKFGIILAIKVEYAPFITL
jgi:hypothetical protein